MEQKTGFNLNNRNQEKIVSLLIGRMHSIGMDTQQQYLNYITSLEGNKDLENLICDITVNESYFFRNTDHWHVFQNFVLPQLIKTKKEANKKSIKIWSAGCSTGEEPYTIAVNLCESSYVLDNFEINIFATDIDNTALNIARKGLYTSNSFRGDNNHLIDKYFLQQNNKFKLKQNIMDMVTFERLNIISSKGFPLRFFNCDIIFCRNMLMYFKPETQSKTVKNIAKCLNKGGFFFLGHSESSLARNTNLNSIHHCNTFVFQKTDKKESQRKIQIEQLESIEQKISVLDRQLDSVSTHSMSNPEIYDPQIKEKTKKNIVKRPEIKSYKDAFQSYLKEDFQYTLKILLSKEKHTSLNIEELLLCALCYINASAFERAGIYIQKAFKKSKIVPEIHMADAMQKEAIGDIDGAVKANQAALFLDNFFFAALFRLGHIYYTAGDRGKADKYFKNAINALKKDQEKRVQLFCGNISFKTLNDICKQLMQP